MDQDRPIEISPCPTIIQRVIHLFVVIYAMKGPALDLNVPGRYRYKAGDKQAASGADAEQNQILSGLNHGLSHS